MSHFGDTSALRRLNARARGLLASSVVRGSVTYLWGNVLNAILPLALLPVLTRYLTPTDYGIVATSTVLIQLVTTTISLNTSGLIVQSQFGDDIPTRRRLISTNIVLAAALAGLLIVVALSAGTLLQRITKVPWRWLPVVIGIAVLTVVQTTYLCVLLSRQEARRFVTLQLLGNVLNLGLSVWLVVGFGMDWRGRMLATFLASLVVGAICMYGLAIRLELFRFAFDRESLRTLVNFGIPLVPHVAGGWAMTIAPRLYLNNLATVGDTGLFGVGYSLASPVALVVGAANQAYLPALFSKLGGISESRQLRLARLIVVAALALPIGALFYGLAARVIVPWIVGPRFLKVADYVIWLALGFAAQGVYFLFANFVVYSRKTSLLAWRGDFAGGLAMLIGCPLLIMLNGPIGAAQATVLAFAVSGVGAFVASRHAVPMPWPAAARSLVAAPFGPTPDEPASITGSASERD